MKDVFIAALFAVILILNLMDVITDVRLGVPALRVMTEGMIVILTAMACIFLLVEMRARTRRLHHLTIELKRSDEALADRSSEMVQARHAYSEAIRKQASSIDAKDGLKGRHAYAAWFLEDAMEPGTLAA